MKALNLPTITQNKDFTGKFSLSWEPSTNSTFYASYSRGIKGAGFNTGFSPGSTVEQNIALAGPVGQEVLDSFEFGVKSRFFVRKLMVQTAGFYYAFKGKQEPVYKDRKSVV